MTRRSRRWVWVLAIASLAILLLAIDLMPVFQYRSEHARMTSLVRPGVNIDQAAAVLRANGFSVGQKYCPTINRDYYWVDVRLIRRRSITADLLCFAGVRMRYFVYGCLESGLDNVIRRIL